MRAQPLALFLVDFERERTRTWSAASTRAAEPSPDVLAKHQNELAAARAAGREEGRADQHREAERLLAEIRRESEVRLAEARAAWVRDQGEVLAAMLTQGLNAIEQRVSEQVAAVLSGLVIEAARQRMIDELATILRDLPTSGHYVLRIEGPDDLIDALRRHLPDRAASVEFVAGAGPDVRVAAGEARLETRLSAWRDAIRSDLA